MLRLNERNEGQRDAMPDALRGVGIFLVVLAHAVQFSAGENCRQSMVFQAIYSFHMAFFFVISGSLFKKPTSVRNGLIRMRRRSLCLLVPYLFWTLFWHVCCMASGGHVGVRAAWATIWFLPVLLVCFWVHTIAALIERVRGLPLPAWLIGVIAVLAMYLVGSTDFWVGSIRYHYIFFLAGTLLGGRYHWRDLSNMWIAVACVVLWVLILPYRQSGLHVPGLDANSQLAKILYLGFKVVLAFLAIYAVSSVVTFSPPCIVRWLSSVGIYSLHIYLMHIGLAQSLCGHVTLFGIVFWLSVGVMMVVPILIGKVTGNHPYASLFLFGRLPVKHAAHFAYANRVDGLECGTKSRCPNVFARGTRT